jgi:DNA mismatch repair protein MSH5
LYGQDSFEALSIFSQDNHPSVVKGSGRAKEGFSLFALLDRAESVAGKRLLKQWMLRPLLNPEVRFNLLRMLFFWANRR